MTVLPTFPLSQIWGVDTGIHGDDLLYRFDRVAASTGLKGGILPSSTQRLSESLDRSPYAQYLGELEVQIDNNWVGEPGGAEYRRLPDSNTTADTPDRLSSGFGEAKPDTFEQLANLAISQLPPGIKNYAQMVEPELRKLIPIETIATIEKGREIYDIAQQISANWQNIATVNQTLPFEKLPELLKIPGANAVLKFINSGIFGGTTNIADRSKSQINWYLNPTFSSAYQSVGANDLQNLNSDIA